MKRRLIIGNWKMNPATLEEARRIYQSAKNISNKLNKTDVVICPPFIYLSTFLNKKIQSSLKIGAQDVFFEESGAFTGEISPMMLKNLGVNYIIIGHSEKRAEGETEELISKKIQAALDIGISPILCVGEKERDTHGNYLDILKTQIKNSLNKVSKKHISKLIVAYEPLWAIGAKDAMDPATVHEMSLFIKKVLSDIYGHDEALSTPILYGGSVNFRNAVDIITKGEVDGLLVGRESINSTGFVELLKVVDLL